jgi:hypothetical protein
MRCTGFSARIEASMGRIVLAVIAVFAILFVLRLLRGTPSGR